MGWRNHPMTQMDVIYWDCPGLVSIEVAKPLGQRSSHSERNPMEISRQKNGMKYKIKYDEILVIWRNMMKSTLNIFEQSGHLAHVISSFPRISDVQCVLGSYRSTSILIFQGCHLVLHHLGKLSSGNWVIIHSDSEKRKLGPTKGSLSHTCPT